jgi:DNA-binding response OmpR family regulator
MTLDARAAMLRDVGAGMSAAVGGERRRTVGEARPQVLVVDRYPDVVELLAYALRRAGIGFMAAHDAASALEAFATLRPPVVVLDPQGLDVLEQLRAFGDDTAIIVLTTGDAGEEARVAALDLGADDYLTKPFSCIELVACVQACLLRGRQHASAHASRTDPRVATSPNWPDWISISRRFFRLHGGQVWTLDGRLPAELMDAGPWPVTHLLL